MTPIGKFVKYNPPKPLFENETQDLLNTGRFRSLVQKENRFSSDDYDWESPGFFSFISKNIPVSTQADKYLARVLVEQRFFRHPEKFQATNQYFAGVYFCRSKKCREEWIHLDLMAGMPGRPYWQGLPQGSKIDDVYLGDANGDGLNDVLVHFTNGLGLLFQAQEVIKNPKTF
jgi:hypothetical protein